jgi:hypothetical protein
VEALTSIANAAGGGGMTGAAGPRGVLFRLPRDAARRLLGVEPEQSVETSVARACAALDAILSRGLPVAYSTPPYFWPEPDPDRCRAQVARAAREMSDFCARRGVPEYDLIEALAAAGAPLGRADDNLHYDLPTRRIQALAIARVVTEALSPTRGDELTSAPNPDC